METITVLNLLWFSSTLKDCAILFWLLVLTLIKRKISTINLTLPTLVLLEINHLFLLLLSPTNKSLHAATRLKAKEKGYKHVWIRGGRIYIRKTDDSEYRIIRDMDSLNKIS